MAGKMFPKGNYVEYMFHYNVLVTVNGEDILMLK